MVGALDARPIPVCPEMLRPESIRQQLGQYADGPALQCLDGAFVLAHGLGGLGDRKAPQEPQHDALLLPGVELLDCGEEGYIRYVIDYCGFWRAFWPVVCFVGVEDVASRDFEPVAAGLEVVGNQVAGDGDQPGAKVAALPGERSDPLERAQEDVGRQVFGELAVVANTEVDESEYDVHVPVVDQAERIGLASLGALHQRPHFGGGVTWIGP